MLAMAGRLAAGKGRHAYIPIKMASGVQDIVMKKTLILQCPGMVCSPPVVSKCLGEAHRRLGIIYITLHYITLHYITLHYITLHYITLHYITLIPSFFPHTVGNLKFVFGHMHMRTYSC